MPGILAVVDGKSGGGVVMGPTFVEMRRDGFDLSCHDCPVSAVVVIEIATSMVWYM